jgi:hypothetical protein
LSTNAQDSLKAITETSSSTSQALVRDRSSTASRSSTRNVRQQPLPLQPLTEIAAGIRDIVAEFKADRERERGVVLAQEEEERSRLNIEVKQRLNSVEDRLAASEEKQNLMISILTRLDSKSREREKENVDT